jgi:hypothetical protein
MYDFSSDGPPILELIFHLFANKIPASLTQKIASGETGAS